MSGNQKEHAGFEVMLEHVLVAVKNGTQKIVTLLVTEVKVIAMIQCIQEMLYVKKFLELMELRVMLPMKVKVDNKGAVDLANGWSISRGTKHMEV